MADTEAAQGEKKGMSTMTLFFLLALPVVLLAGLAAAQMTGLVDLSPHLRSLPVIGSFFPQRDPASEGFQQTLEEHRIAQLQAEKEALDAKLAEMQAAAASAQSTASQDDAVKQQKVELEQQLAALKEQAEKDKQAQADREKLAERLSVMKPASAAKIMENLPDDMVNQLLNGMDVDKAAKITAALSPARAARLSMATGDGDAAARKKADSDLKKSELTKSNYQNLAQTMAAMKADDAAMLMEQLPDEMTASILREMNKDAAGKVLSALTYTNPTRAARLVNLMGRPEG
ncbi:hypothetical protein HM1_2226 [Heliomicrobium modesticaldum Ice1]|uniref:Magnesium transporter MgtE intracellular domain-containing protein n=1 Tax=Heliobacterium modesticaldum (strain ATCC 51547 / Ice1) TaxID=498761 RepID=B0THA7_HELMI|nr:hypothetical protein [Heliomicrobium modesticaldum]ABZ84782.1 hypothetical protein HM1_2226 [Heliomicrobium modesticaldum Ice1]